AIGSISANDTTLCQYDSVYLSAYYVDGWCYSYQWKRNGINIPGATMSYYYAKAAGNYKCIISNAGVNVTSNTITITACNTVATRTKSSNSIKSESSVLDELKLKVTPNPVTTSATISFSLRVTGKVSIKLYDNTGRLTKNLIEQNFTQGIQQLNLDAKDLHAG